MTHTAVGATDRPEPPISLEEAVSAIVNKVQSVEAHYEAQKREAAQAIPRFNRALREVERALLESSMSTDRCNHLVASVRGLVVVSAQLSQRGATVLSDGTFVVE